MSVTYNVRESEGVTIVDLIGRIGLGESMATGPGSGVEFHSRVTELIKAGHKRILLNLSKVVYIDSAGIGELFGVFLTVRSQGGTLKITVANEQVQHLLQLTKLNSVIDVIQEESTAVQSFRNGRTSPSARPSVSS